MNSNVVDILYKLALFSLGNHVSYRLQEHVSWVMMSMNCLNSVNSRNNLNLSNISQITCCPIHGWTEALKRSSPNKCLKCFRNRLFYRKKAKTGQNPLKSTSLYE